MFNLSGLFRDVTLLALPKEVHIFDLKWRTLLDYGTKVATVGVDVELRWNQSLLEELLKKEYSTSTDIYKKGVDR